VVVLLVGPNESGEDLDRVRFRLIREEVIPFWANSDRPPGLTPGRGRITMMCRQGSTPPAQVYRL
jgi:hypothetical protein